MAGVPRLRRRDQFLEGIPRTGHPLFRFILCHMAEHRLCCLSRLYAQVPRQAIADQFFQRKF